MAGLLDRQMSSYRFGVEFSKPAKTRHKKFLYNYKRHFGPIDVSHNVTLEQLRTLKKQHFGVLVSFLIGETQAPGPDSQKYLDMLNPTDPCDQVTQLQLRWRLELKASCHF